MTTQPPSTPANHDREGRIAQMAAALTGRLGGDAIAFVTRQADLSDGDIRVTWQAIRARLEHSNVAESDPR